MPEWQFWGAHNDGQSLIQREANDRVEEATNPCTSIPTSLCQSISALPKGPRHLASHCHVNPTGSLKGGALGKQQPPQLCSTSQAVARTP